MPVEKLTPARRREMTRTALIEAAAEVFAHKGFAGASLEEIAEAAGFTRGAIYSNFGNKEDLLFGVLEHFQRTQLEAVTGMLHTEGRHDPVSDAIAANRQFEAAGPLTAIWPALTLELRVSAMRNPAVRKRLAEVQRGYIDGIAKLAEDESARTGVDVALPPRELAAISNAAIDGLTQMATIDVEHADWYQKLIEKLLTILAEASMREPSP